MGVFIRCVTAKEGDKKLIFLIKNYLVLKCFKSQNQQMLYILMSEGAKKTDVKVVGTFEEPWFCGKDVCEILEYTNVKQALQINVQQKNKKTLKELSGGLTR